MLIKTLVTLYNACIGHIIWHTCYAECEKRLLEMSSVAKNNRLIPAIDKLDNSVVSVTDDKPL